MKLDLEKIQNKVPYFGSTKLDPIPNWDEELNYLDKHPVSNSNSKAEKIRIYLTHCLWVEKNKLPKWAEEVALDMAEVFRKNPISLIKFYGFGQESDSYPYHKDSMDVLLVQAIGTVKLKVEGTNYEDKPRLFRPGHSVWIPRGTHHQVIASSSRLTYSYGVEGEPDPAKYN